MRLILFILVALTGLTTTICGMLLIAHPGGVVLGLTTTLLKGTFLNDFTIPGIILTLVGAINIAAIFSQMQRSRNRYNWSLAGGIMISGWIIAQVILVHVIHWLQFVFLATGIFIILLSFQLKGKWAI
jgi:hypothetical protein